MTHCLRMSLINSMEEQLDEVLLSSVAAWRKETPSFLGALDSGVFLPAPQKATWVARLFLRVPSLGTAIFPYFKTPTCG